MNKPKLIFQDGKFVDEHGNDVIFNAEPVREKTDKPYIEQRLTYTNDGRLLDENGYAVMMDWEDPIMEHQAWTVASNGGDILNVGFGLGIIDTYIQSYNPKTHWIIECHPDVQRKMIQDGWLKKPNVRCIFAKWQDVIHYLPKFDGIYWDTWEESPRDFHLALPELLKPTGIFSYFNKPTKEDLDKGLVVPEAIGIELDPIMDAHYTTIELKEVPSYAKQGRVYWTSDMTTYYNPILTLKKEHQSWD